MNEYLNIVRFTSVKDLPYEEQHTFIENLNNLKGVTKLYIASTEIVIEYNSYQISEFRIGVVMKEKGFVPEVSLKRKGFLKRLIQTLATNNKKYFGNQKLECCNLNK